MTRKLARAVDPVDEPIDWNSRDPAFVTRDDDIERFGRDSVPTTLLREVFAREDDAVDLPSFPTSGARSIAISAVGTALAQARTSEEAAGILKSQPLDIAQDALWAAIAHDHEQITAHEVGAMRLRDHAYMLRSVTRGGASHLDADIPF